jgi:hypothetical protein
VRIALIVYALGVLIGLAVMRDRFVPRLVTAVLWPLGPITGIVVVCGLLVVAVILWPVLMLVSAAVITGAVYLLA